MGSLVLAGGGHAHMVALSRIRELISRGHRVTVIGPSPHHYYSGMGPGLLSGRYRPWSRIVRSGDGVGPAN